ncbi:thioredoxin domain-containing protein [Streptomyces sp. AV19]|uniref:thioredoxin domain-containing protein n=1 Tax=Streptomyces sp. AV19 TaxID=2793068 RepID=UPI0018FE76E6|nr:thioredoxin domain-containing protein [Streptomyces sp. AV19]MBH1936271.1 thioredoxin domain-containing protein [Streptomyces sp. AV19]MDG4532306.1 DsbA family protein [Streptomyces sp. AV19]
MSNRNNAQNKQAARERLRAERERQAKKDKTRRQLMVAGSLVVVLAVAGGVAYAVTQMNKTEDGPWKAAASKPLVKPAGTSGKDGTELVIGDKNAKETLTVYEDPRCPICSVFEQNSGQKLRQDVKEGRYKVRYVLASFIDDNPAAKGTGSRNAVSALGAAFDVSPEAFADYKEALFSKRNHPEETDDAFADDKKLLDIAQQVPALKNNKDFEKNVKDGTFDRWALEIGKLMGKDGVKGTPALMHNKKQLTVPGTENPPIMEQQFNATIDAEFGAKKK